MRYYLGKNGLEYQNLEDAQKYGEGVVGFRETTTEVKAVTYQELTGKEPPESPVDHVIVPKEVIETPTGPVPVTDLTPTEEFVPVQEAVIPEPTITVTVPVTFKEERHTFEVPPLNQKIEIIQEKPQIVATNLTENVTIVDWASKTDQDLRAMCREKRVKGYAFMKRENMIKKLS